MTFLKKNLIYILLGLIMATGLFLRLVPLSTFYKQIPSIQSKMAFNGDALGYQQFAKLFLDKGTFSVLDKKNEIYFHSTIPALTTFRVPLFPYFLSRIYVVFGESTFPVFLIQSLLDTTTICLIFFITVLVFKNKKFALLASLLYAISPLAIMYTTSMFADSLFTFSFTVFILLVIRLFQKNTFKRSVAVGLSLAVATLIKPIGIYFLPVIVLSLFFTFPNIKHEWKKYLISILVLAVSFFVAIAPWQLRNLIVAGHYSLTWQQGRDLLVFREGTCRAWVEGANRKLLWAEIQRPYIKIKDPFARSLAEQQEFKRYAMNNFGDLVGCTSKGIRRFFITTDLFATAGGNEISQSGYQFASNGITNSFLHTLGSNKFWVDMSHKYANLLYCQYVIIIFGGVLLLIKKQYRAAVIFFILTILYFAALSGVDGYARYRYPLTPILAILTAGSIFAIAEFFQKIKKRKIWKK